MIYGAWVEQELAHYQRDLETLEREYDDKAHPEYLERRASIVQCVKMLEELGDVAEEDSA
jgi:hypothetical protein